MALTTSVSILITLVPRQAKVKRGFSVTWHWCNQYAAYQTIQEQKYLVTALVHVPPF